VSELLAALIGIVAGALASGLTQFLFSRRDLTLSRIRSARLVYGELVAASDWLASVLRDREWGPDLGLMETVVPTWREERRNLAAAVPPDVWMTMDGAFYQVRQALAGAQQQVAFSDGITQMVERAIVAVDLAAEELLDAAYKGRLRKRHVVRLRESNELAQERLERLREERFGAEEGE
jgi:hypothetical protein